MVAASKNITVAALAKECKFFAIRARMRRGLVTASDLTNAKADGRTATEWLQKISDDWKVNCPEGEHPSTPSNVLAEMVYRYVSMLR